MHDEQLMEPGCCVRSVWPLRSVSKEQVCSEGARTGRSTRGGTTADFLLVLLAHALTHQLLQSVVGVPLVEVVNGALSCRVGGALDFELVVGGKMALALDVGEEMAHVRKVGPPWTDIAAEWDIARYISL